VASRRSAILVGLDVRLDMEATDPVVELPCQLGDGSAWHVKQRLDLVRHEPNSECETRPDWVQKEIPPESGIFAREMCESAHPTWSRDPLARSGPPKRAGYALARAVHSLPPRWKLPAAAFGN
jgi:hypothetical protein